MGEEQGAAWLHYKALLKDDSLFVRSLQLAPNFDVAEIGVLGGRVFSYMAKWANSRLPGRCAHAFDSFCGMDEPSPKDSRYYPKGRLSVGGVDNFIERMKQMGVEKDKYVTWQGYIPECFKGVSEEQVFGFIRIDVDHYRPTLMAAWWAWEKLAPGGFLSFDDWMPEYIEALATNAIQAFIREMYKEIASTAVEGREILIKKKESDE